jgi:hypothetical protein
MIYFGRLPVRLIRAPVFIRPVGFAGVGWIAIALLSPGAILHYQLLIALMTLYAWWKLRSEDAFGGKLWLTGASGLGIGPAVVLILAVTPGAYPAARPWWDQVGFLASIYFGGAVIGLAAVLHRFTRRAATEAGVSPKRVEDYARLLFIFTLARFVVQLAPLDENFRVGITPGAGSIGATAILFFLPLFAWWAGKRARSPAPSASGAPLLALVFAGTIAEILTRG